MNNESKNKDKLNNLKKDNIPKHNTSPSTNQNNYYNQKNHFGYNKNGYNNQSIGNYKKAIAKEGLKTAANVYAPGVGGKVVEELSKTKTGDKILNQATDNSNILPKNPFSFFKSKRKTNELQEEQDNQKDSVKGTIELTKQITKFMAIAPGLLSGCFVFLIIVTVICVIISPLFYMDSLLGKTDSFFEKIGNFVTLRGWCTDEECAEIEKNNFYEEVEKVYLEYKQEKNVELNTSLIIATLTYSDPLVTIESIEEGEIDGEFPSSNLIDFKKSKKLVSRLAQNMVSEDILCFDQNNQEIDCDSITEENESEITKTTKYVLDIDKYRDYLEVYFIRNFYFDNKNGENINIKIENVIDEIFSRVEFYEFVSSSENSSTNFGGNNVTVTILDCNNGLVMEEVSLYEYIQGVLYVEGYATERSEEFLKLMAVVVKNYLYSINNVDANSLPNNLRIKSCEMNQIYCNVSEGCHSMGDGTDNSSNTIVSGPDENGNYYQKPLDDVETIKKIKNAIDSTLSEFVIENEKFVYTQYRASCNNEICDSTTNIMDQTVANNMINSGSSYQEVLNYFYKGSIEEVNVSTAGYPLDLNNNYVTSAFGWRVDPKKNCCTTHNGTDISAPADANIYSIADGVVVQNVANHYSYGNYIVIGHGNFDSSTGKYEYYSLYAHQIRHSTLVSVGTEVKGGQLIGNVGSTGYSTGYHLHIEIYRYVNNRKIREDAVTYFEGVQLTGMVGGALYDSGSDCIKQSGCSYCG